MFATNITKEEINELPLDRYQGEIVIVDREAQLKNCIESIRKHKVVGFDTETKPVFVKGQSNDVALVQIAIPEKVYLIRINVLGLIQELISLFENPNIIKVGVGLRDDLLFLNKMQPFKAKGFVEINEIVNKINIDANGLRKLTAIILGFRISKNAQVSNWEAQTLNKKQEIYAATDAWVCLKMYDKLKQLELI